MFAFNGLMAQKQGVSMGEKSTNLPFCVTLSCGVVVEPLDLRVGSFCTKPRLKGVGIRAD